VLHPPEQLKPRDLPEKLRPNWALTGPGAILVGLSIGAGEIIIWPRIAAEYGAKMAWAALAGVFLQLWLNFEIGRWTIATGETVYCGFARVWRGFAPLFILFNILGWLAPGWARASGSAMKALLVGPSWHSTANHADFFGTDTFWTILTFALVALVLFGPKLVYRSVEITVEALVLIVTTGLVLVAINVGNAATWRDLGGGLINIGHIDPRMDVKAFFIALVFAGAGGTANLFYSFYLRDKQIGMASWLPRMLNPLRGRSQATPATGFRFPETPDNLRRFRAWFGFVCQDQTLYFFALNSLTILLFIFGALAVLHPGGTIPAPGSLIWDEASILGHIWGAAGRMIFLLVGVATLFSTQLTLVDGVARSIADIVYTSFPAARKRDVGWWYVSVAIVWIVVGIAMTWLMEKRGVSELGFLFNAAYMGGFAMAVYAPLLMVLNHRLLPKGARPGIVCTSMLAMASIVYIGFALACVYWELCRMMGTGG